MAKRWRTFGNHCDNTNLGEVVGRTTGVRLSRGQAVAIRSIAVEYREAKTFNLSIENTSTYFVMAGETPVLVHNQGLFVGIGADAGYCWGPCAGSYAASGGLYIGSEGVGVYGSGQVGFGAGAHAGFGLEGGFYRGSMAGTEYGVAAILGFGVVGSGSVTGAPGSGSITVGLGGPGGGYYVGPIMSHTQTYGLSWQDIEDAWDFARRTPMGAPARFGWPRAVPGSEAICP